MSSVLSSNWSKGLFFLISAMHVIGLAIGLEWLSVSTKPLLLLSLFLFYITKTAMKNNLFISAMVFSFLGDVFLISNSELNFMFGLGSFLTAHILYILLVGKQLNKSLVKDKIVATIPFVGVFIGLIYFLKDSLGELLIPVVIYGLVISTFGAVSLLNYRGQKTEASVYLLFGSLFFILSDSILAINKFYETNLWFPVIVMITYISAQYLICQFMIKREKIY